MRGLGCPSASAREVHCPNCGEFICQAPPRIMKSCPQCGNEQAIILFYRHDQRLQQDWEREQARPERYRVRP